MCPLGSIRPIHAYDGEPKLVYGDTLQMYHPQSLENDLSISMIGACEGLS